MTIECNEIVIGCKGSVEVHLKATRTVFATQNKTE
jgi:hypothetical protein